MTQRGVIRGCLLKNIIPKRKNIHFENAQNIVDAILAWGVSYENTVFMTSFLISRWGVTNNGERTKEENRNDPIPAG